MSPSTSCRTSVFSEEVDSTFPSENAEGPCITISSEDASVRAPDVTTQFSLIRGNLTAPTAMLFSEPQYKPLPPIPKDATDPVLPCTTRPHPSNRLLPPRRPPPITPLPQPPPLRYANVPLAPPGLPFVRKEPRKSPRVSLTPRELFLHHETSANLREAAAGDFSNAFPVAKGLKPIVYQVAVCSSGCQTQSDTSGLFVYRIYFCSSARQ
jgi:hypothetical protein